MASRNPLARAETALQQFALSYPESYEEFPWGHRAVKVKGKVFLFMSKNEPNGLNLSMKLPLSGKLALNLPFTSPTEYGLGKSGWVTARFGAKEEVPVDMLKEWIDESFRAVAPKKLLAELELVESDGGEVSRGKAVQPKPKLRKHRSGR
jgi:predicted DNA-binding protein (MmcQ/YjbR family)